MQADPHIKTRIKLCGEMLELFENTLKNAPSPKHFSDVYIIGISLQFRSNLQAAINLLSTGFDSEVWILARSMSEICLRVKWVKKRKSNAAWLIVGEQLQERNRLEKQKVRRKLKSAAIKAIDDRLAATMKTLPKHGRFWNPKDKTFLRTPPSAEKMAKECNMLGVYRSWFKWGSVHTHGSQFALERFMVLDEQRNFIRFSLEPVSSEISEAARSILSIAGFLLVRLKKSGWPLDDKRMHDLIIAAKEIE